MKFNVDGNLRELIAREYQPDTAFDDMPDVTESLLEDYLSHLPHDFLHRHYKVDENKFAELEEIVRLNNENVRIRSGLNTEQQSAYDDWDMTRCMSSVDTMVKKEYDFLHSLTDKDN